MKEIGSIFTLTSEQILNNKKRSISFYPGRIYYSLCREAFGDIAKRYDAKNKIVLIPAYTCQTVIDPFKEQGWEIEFYSICKDLRIDLIDLERKASIFSPSIIVAHPYFGMDLSDSENEILSNFQGKGSKIIIDLTQCIFSKHNYSYADYIVGSYRKWYSIPDGGYLMTDEKGFEQPIGINDDFTNYQTEAMYLREVYSQNHEQLMKDISIKLNKTADKIAERTIKPHRISDLAYNLLLKQDSEYNQKRRLINFTYLHQNTNEGKYIRKVCKNLKNVTTAPLYFTIYTNKRRELQMQLAKNSIYAPVIWPVEEERVLINEDIRYIYNHLLAIPCDQRYDLNDMQRIVRILNEFNEKN